MLQNVLREQHRASKGTCFVDADVVVQGKRLFQSIYALLALNSFDLRTELLRKLVVKKVIAGTVVQKLRILVDDYLRS